MCVHFFRKQIMFMCLFFVCPKKTNQKKKHFSRGVFFLNKQDKTAIKTDPPFQ